MPRLHINQVLSDQTPGAGLFNAFSPIYHIPLIGLILVVTYVLSDWFYNLFFSPLRHVPGPKLWAMTNLFNAYRNLSGVGVWQTLGLHDKYGPVIRVAPNFVSINDPSVWKDVIAKTKGREHVHDKDPIFYFHNKDGILSKTGASHARMRRILAQEFSTKALAGQQPIINAHIDLLFKLLKDKSGNGAIPLDLNKWFMWTTFDIISDLAFGESFSSLKILDYAPWLQLIQGAGTQWTVLLQLRRMFPNIDAYVYPIMKMSGSIERHEKELSEKIERRRALGGTRNDFLRSIMSKTDDGQEKLSPEEILGNASVLILAGGESIATTITSLVYYLCKNPHTLARVKQDVRSMFKSEGEITVRATQDLAYLSAAIHEALRLVPPVPEDLPRVIGKDGDTICGTYLPPHTVVGSYQWVLNHDPKFWSEPESFIPERWLDDPRFKNDKKEAHQPFSVGFSDCIGKGLALSEIRVIASRLIWNYDFELAHESQDWGDRVRVRLAILMPPLNVHLRPRVS